VEGKYGGEKGREWMEKEKYRGGEGWSRGKYKGREE
jgi:hypothetical protein